MINALTISGDPVITATYLAMPKEMVVIVVSLRYGSFFFDCSCLLEEINKVKAGFAELRVNLLYLTTDAYGLNVDKEIISLIPSSC